MGRTLGRCSGRRPGAFRDELLGGELAYIPGELDLVAGDLALALDPD
jgi:hypothetical protein